MNEAGLVKEVEVFSDRAVRGGTVKPAKLVRLVACVVCYKPVGLRYQSPVRSFDEPRKGMVHQDCLVKQKSYIITVKGRKKTKEKMLMGPLRRQIELNMLPPDERVVVDEKAAVDTAVVQDELTKDQVMAAVKRANDKKGLRLVRKG